MHLSSRTGLRVEFPPDGILGPRGLAELLEAGHVDVVVTEKRVGVLEVDPVDLLVVGPLQELGDLRAVGAPSVGPVLPLPDHHVAPIGRDRSHSGHVEQLFH